MVTWFILLHAFLLRRKWGLCTLQRPKRQYSCSSLRAQSISMNRLCGAERMTFLPMFQNPVFHMVSAKLVGTWKKGGMGEKTGNAECLSSHSTNKTNLFGKLEKYYFRNSFSNIGRVISIGIKFQSNLYRVLCGN